MNNSEQNKYKKNNWHRLAVICALCILLFSCVFFFVYSSNNKLVGDILFKVVYYDDNIPGSKYDIDIYSNGITILKTNFCSSVDCKETTEKIKNIKYSNGNIKKLTEFVTNNFLIDQYNTAVVYNNDLNSYQKDVITGITLNEYFFEIAVEKYEYRIEYDETDNLFYEIYLKSDDSILVKKCKVNNNFDITNIKTYNIEFSSKNMKILKNYIENLFENENSNFINKYVFYGEYDNSIINSIILNNEKYLNDIDKKSKLAYTISYSGINCLTPVLYLYDNGKYEYYYTFSTGNKKPKPKTGKYDYDLNKIIEDAGSFDDKWMDIGIYTVHDFINNKSYYVSLSNNEISEFLKSVGVSLGKCLEQQ